MQNRATALLAVAMLVCLMPAAAGAFTPYSQDFESLIQVDPGALAGDGWLVFGNVSTPAGVYLYGYGPFPAPNDGAAFCQIDVGQGGVDQGLQQLVTFSDYNNGDHANGNIIESNVFQEQTIAAADVGWAVVFEFQAKRGNIEGGSTAAAFIKTLDPSAGYALTNFKSVDMTAIPDTWGGYSLFLVIDDTLEGQLLQFGFLDTATHYEGSGIFYDNIDVYLSDSIDVPEATAARGMLLHQNYPNPFNPKTRIEFMIEQAGDVVLSVFDLAGRRVATMPQGALGAGSHSVTWDGNSDLGSPAAAGQYWYVLDTPSGRVSRSMTLLK